MFDWNNAIKNWHLWDDERRARCLYAVPPLFYRHTCENGHTMMHECEVRHVADMNSRHPGMLIQDYRDLTEPRKNKNLFCFLCKWPNKVIYAELDTGADRWLWGLEETPYSSRPAFERRVQREREIAAQRGKQAEFQPVYQIGLPGL